MTRMSGWRKHPLRVAARLLWFGVELVLGAVRYIPNCAFQTGDALASAQARWLQRTACRILRILNLTIQTDGPVPRAGLLVSNHLGYVDVVVIASLVPSRFVSKYEVKHWPVFGTFARLAGTIFVQRERRLQTVEAASEIEQAFSNDVLLVLFPEGTSSDGTSVLPFKSPLLEPAVRKQPLITTAFIRYELDDGDPREDVAYWRDMTLIPHLLNLLSKRSVRAFLRFEKVDSMPPDRKLLARQLRSKIFHLGGLEEDSQKETKGTKKVDVSDINR